VLAAGTRSGVNVSLLADETEPWPTPLSVLMFLVEGYRDFRRQREPYRRCARGRTTDRAQLQPDILSLQARIGLGVHRPFALRRIHSTSESKVEGRQTATGRQGLSHGHRIRLAQWNPVGDATARTGVRLGMSCWRRLRDWQEAGIWDRSTSSCLTGYRAVAKLIGQGQSWIAVPYELFLGEADWDQSNRPGETWQQASSAVRRWRSPPCWEANRSESQRLAASTCTC